jgi:hypothetical protein
VPLRVSEPPAHDKHHSCSRVLLTFSDKSERLEVSLELPIIMSPDDIENAQTI